MNFDKISHDTPNNPVKLSRRAASVLESLEKVVYFIQRMSNLQSKQIRMERTASKRTNSLEHLSLARKEDIRLFVCNLNKSGNFRFFKREDVTTVCHTAVSKNISLGYTTKSCLLRICPSGKDPITFMRHLRWCQFCH